MKYYNTVTKTVTEAYIDDATTVAWDDVRVKHFFAPLPVGYRLEYDANGFPLIVEIPLPTDAELLEQAKASKLQQIEEDYSIADAIPVVHNAVTYKGGESSAKGIRDYLEGNRLEGITIHHIWDINGTEKPYTDSEANAVLIAVNTPVRDNSFNKKNRKVALAVATTIAEVEAI